MSPRNRALGDRWSRSSAKRGTFEATDVTSWLARGHILDKMSTCLPEVDKLIASRKGWLGIRVVSVLTQSQKGLGSNRRRDAVG